MWYAIPKVKALRRVRVSRGSSDCKMRSVGKPGPFWDSLSLGINPIDHPIQSINPIAHPVCSKRDLWALLSHLMSRCLSRCLQVDRKRPYALSPLSTYTGLWPPSFFLTCILSQEHLPCLSPLCPMPSSSEGTGPPGDVVRPGLFSAAGTAGAAACSCTACTVCQTRWPCETRKSSNAWCPNGLYLNMKQNPVWPQSPQPSDAWAFGDTHSTSLVSALLFCCSLSCLQRVYKKHEDHRKVVTYAMLSSHDP